MLARAHTAWARAPDARRTCCHPRHPRRGLPRTQPARQASRVHRRHHARPRPRLPPVRSTPQPVKKRSRKPRRYFGTLIVDPHGVLRPGEPSARGEVGLFSGQEIPVLLAGWHGVNDQFFAALEDEDNCLKQASVGVEAEPQFAVRPVLLIEWLHPDWPVGRLDCVVCKHSVLESAVMDLHAAKPANALRIASDREMCSRSAMASTAASSSAVRRTATTCIGSAPRPGRPRPRRFISSTSYPSSAS